MIGGHHALEGFASAIAAAGMEPPGDLIGDGKLRRFSASGKPRDDTGWYVLHDDGIPAGVFGDWRTGLQESWCAKSETELSAEERQAQKERSKAAQVMRAQEQLARQADAAQAAAVTWNAAAAAVSHPYLVAKNIRPHNARVDGSTLLIPMRDTSGEIHSSQRIEEDGSKRFAVGGKVKGCYCAIGKPSGMVIVCEGFATGASIHEATGHAVAVAFNSGNLLPVASALHAKHPKLQIVIAADDDWKTMDRRTGELINPGMKAAQRAADEVGGRLAVPDFAGTSRGEKDTDMNDLARLAGHKAVSRSINQAQRTAMSGWAEPTPLPSALPPVMPFDPHLLPEALRGWVMDIAHRMQCPPDFSAVGAVVALSSLIGARAAVQPKARDDWQVVPNLWGLIVGRPGVMKSPALGESLKPLHRLQAAEFEQFEDAHAAWTLDRKVEELASASREKTARGLATKDPAAARALLAPVESAAEPFARRYIVNDATVEKLGELMQNSPWGTLSYRDELYGLLTGMDKQGQEGARAFYLQSYDGNQGYTFDRIQRGTVHIPRVCLAMIGGIQPGRIQEYVRGAVSGGSADDGLLQRFSLTVWPDTSGEFVHVDQWPDTPAKARAWDVFERLATMQAQSDTEPAVWRFDAAAQELFFEWRTPFEQELKRGELHPAMESHLAKYRKLIPALALVFAVIDTPEAGVIGERELIRALAWGDYLRSHAERLYSAAVTPETGAAAGLLTKIKTGKLIDVDGVIVESFTPRQVALKGWTGLGTPEAVRKAADVLCDFDWLRREEARSEDSMGRGRPSERYSINPRARGAL